MFSFPKNGGEYTSNEFVDFRKDARVEKEIIVAYNPQQNDVAKRKKKLIMEVARAMLDDPKLLKFLWVESMNTMVYVQTKVPHQALENKNPEYVFICVILDIGHRRIFGCPMYIHMSKDKRNKMEVTKKKCTFVGYCGNYKSFRIYVPSQRKSSLAGM